MTDLLEVEQLETWLGGDEIAAATYHPEPLGHSPVQAVEAVDPSPCTPVHYLVLWGIIVVGVMLRVSGLTSGGLWTSDAWVALSSRVGIGTAWHMWANAPGFDLFERSWVMLHPGSPWWGQIPPLVLGITAIPAIFYLTRYFRCPTWLSLGAALVVSVSPICVVFSTRYKDYGADFLLACAVLALAERARRQPANRPLFVLSAISIMSFAVSASMLPVLLGAWAALGLLTLAKRQHALPAMILTGFTCLLIWEAFYRHLSPYLHRYWSGHFLTFTSPHALFNSVSLLTVDVFNGLIGLPAGPLPLNLLEASCLGGLLVLGVARRSSMMAPALVLGSAYVASAFGAIPLGTGRTDEVLYPAILLLLASGIQRMGQLINRRTTSTPRRLRKVGAVGIVVAVAALLFVGMGTNNKYHSVDIRTLESEIDRGTQPGDHVVVDPFLRYSWALYEDAHPHIVFGPDWFTGFTVASTQPSVFIDPSFFSIEGGSHISTWVNELGRYKRLWIVDTFDHRPGDIYDALRHAGWRPTHVLLATGCEAILLVHVA